MQEHTGELMARVEDAEAAHAEVLVRNEQIEKDAKNLKIDLETFSFFSTPDSPE